jgi:hypothetical protein
VRCGELPEQDGTVGSGDLGLSGVAECSRRAWARSASMGGAGASRSHPRRIRISHVRAQLVPVVRAQSSPLRRKCSSRGLLTIQVSLCSSQISRVGANASGVSSVAV